LTPASAGSNSYGQLGLGDTETRGDTGDKTPFTFMNHATGNYVYINYPNEMGDFLPAVSLGADLTATAIASGGEHSCALLSNGQLKCWGESPIFMCIPCPCCH